MKHLSTFLTITVLLIALMSCDRDDATTDPPPVGPGTQEATSTPEPTPASRRSPEETADPNRRPVGTATPTPTPRRVVTVPGLAADSFIAVVPRTLRTGYSERVSVSLFNGDRPVSGHVRLTLLDAGTSVLTVDAKVDGAANIELPVPHLERGKYEIEVEVEEVSETRRA